MAKGDGRGGARKGAGRPKNINNINSELIRKAIHKIYGGNKNLEGEAAEEAILDMLADYATKDIKGVQYLVERHLGKPVVKIEADISTDEARDADDLLHLLEDIDE